VKRLLLLVGLFLVVCLCLVGCGGGSPPQLPVPQLAGQWEIIAEDDNSPHPAFPMVTYIEVNFNEDSQGNLSADPIVFAAGTGPPAPSYPLYSVGGYCGGPPNPLSGFVKTNNNVNFTWTEGAVQFTASGQIQNDGTVTGSYNPRGTSYCAQDFGHFVATRTAKNLAGTYVGFYNFQPFPSLTLTITAANGNSVTVNGSDSVNGNFTLQGTQIANCVVVSGTIGVQSSTVYGLSVAGGPELGLIGPGWVAFLTKQ
jgi:hypothetical protein